jgi:uncharacterized SAM-binding protein YcdF (DUF218 family)
VIAAAILLVFAAFCLTTARLFVWYYPPAMPGQVDAIVVLGGDGVRLDLGVQLAAEGRARYLLLSTGLPWLPPGICTGHIVDTATVICFHPDPDTTAGEAEVVSRIAKAYHWKSMALVTTQDQAWRARLRFGRCYPGELYGATSPVSLGHWPFAIAYQWAGTIKAGIFQRGC